MLTIRVISTIAAILVIPIATAHNGLMGISIAIGVEEMWIALGYSWLVGSILVLVLESHSTFSDYIVFVVKEQMVRYIVLLPLDLACYCLSSLDKTHFTTHYTVHKLGV
jgi:hypothetical protein